MFIITENQNIILGPMDWRPTTFKNVLLDDLEISFNVPYNNANNEVITVNENVKILPVINLPLPDTFNSKIQDVNGPYYNFYDNYAELYYTPIPKNIDICKSELKNIISANRWKYEIKGVTITLQGKEITLITQRGERDIYLQAYQMGKDNINWKFENIFLTLSNQELGLIVLSVSTYIQNVFDWESDKYNAIETATTLEELDLIELTNSSWE